MYSVVTAPAHDLGATLGHLDLTLSKPPLHSLIYQLWPPPQVCPALHPRQENQFTQMWSESSLWQISEFHWIKRKVL